jgi:hypothetical protein
MKSRMATPKLIAHPGDVIDVPPEHGKQLVEGGFAVYQPGGKVTAQPLEQQRKNEPPVETASIEPPETPEATPRKRRGRPAG